MTRIQIAHGTLSSLLSLCQTKLSLSEGKQRQAVDKTVADLNIEHFRKLLAIETDPAKRQTIERLLAEEEAKLARAMVNKTGTQGQT
jgi:glutamate formiminotransferase